MRYPSAVRLLCALVLLSPSLAPPARGVPVAGHFVDDARCDPVPETSFSHEIGELPFPLDELIVDVTIQPDTPICVPDDAQLNDFVVSMVNASPTAWSEVFFVADDGFTVGNADGTLEDVGGAPGVFNDAFRIDGTVTPGVNSPLVFESMTVDEVFEPGEIWIFRVTNFTGGPPVFDSPGAFAGSSPGGSPSNASLVAIPEPSAALLALAGLAFLGRRQRRRG